MPRLTCSASLRKCALHGVSSDQVLQMPMIGRPSNSWSGMPWFFIQLRYMKPFLSAVPNHWAERSLGFDSDMGACVTDVVVEARASTAARHSQGARHVRCLRCG